MQEPQAEVAATLVGRIESGDEDASRELFELVYDQLHRLAHRYLTREGPGHTLQTTALVHEAYLRLVPEAEREDHEKFFLAAARTMRRVLVDHARRRNRLKRRPGGRRMAFDEALERLAAGSQDALEINDALERLRKIDVQLSRVFELRFFAGLSLEETAHALGVSRTTVVRDWRAARAWMLAEMER